MSKIKKIVAVKLNGYKFIFLPVFFLKKNVLKKKTSIELFGVLKTLKEKIWNQHKRLSHVFDTLKCNYFGVYVILISNNNET